MLGRATIEAPRMITDRPGLLARLEYLDEIRRTFWRKWTAVVFQGQDHAYKWRTVQRDMRPGDVVLMKDETRAHETYRLGRVETVYPSQADGKVRRVQIAYRNPGENKNRLSERPVHKLVLIVPLEEQAAASEAARADQEGEKDIVEALPVPEAQPQAVQDAFWDADIADEEAEDDPPVNAWAGRLRKPCYLEGAKKTNPRRYKKRRQ